MLRNLNGNDTYNTLKIRVSRWLFTLQDIDNRLYYKLSKSTDGSLFTLCFAIFILDVFNLTNHLSSQIKREVTFKINSHQDKETGLFLPSKSHQSLINKTTFQLSSFCLSTLKILDGKPQYPINIINKYNTRAKLKDYLDSFGCDNGLPGSGNMAMFIAIFLTFELDRTKKVNYKKLIDFWFEYHDYSQNQSTGFWSKSWGKDDLKPTYFAYQNAYHQFEIYNYYNRPIPNIDKIIDILLSIQGSHGSFSPGIKGGYGSCWDYDAASILASSINNKIGYRTNDIIKSLNRLKFSIIYKQNDDGGFPQLNSKDMSVNYIQLLPHIFSGGLKPLLWFERLFLLYSRGLANIRNKNQIKTSWANTPRKIAESNLWDSWFSLLTIGIIDTSINNCEMYNFHRSIGIGYF